MELAGGIKLQSERLDGNGVDHNVDDIFEGDFEGHVPQEVNLNARKVKEKIMLKKGDRVGIDSFTKHHKTGP